MPRVEPTAAHHHLSRGAFGVGEEHGTPNARQLVLDLIDYGIASRIFVELYESRFGPQLDIAKGKAAAGALLGEVIEASPSGDLDARNPVGLSQVIGYALFKGAEVYLADSKWMAHRSQTRTKFQNRHAEIQRVFCEVTGQNSPPLAVHESSRGCLLLWGGAHFERDTALDNYIIGLPFAMMG